MAEGKIPFIGRWYYRFLQGSAVMGIVNWIANIAGDYKLYKDNLTVLHIDIVEFMVIGVIGFLSLVAILGFAIERIGIIKAVQSHQNTEVNPEWVDAYDKIKKMADKMDVK